MNDLFRNYKHELVTFIDFVIDSVLDRYGIRHYVTRPLYDIKKGLSKVRVSRNEYKEYKHMIINIIGYALQKKYHLTEKDAHDMAKHIEYEYRDYRRA